MVKRGFDSPSRLWLPQWGSFFMQFFCTSMTEIELLTERWFCVQEARLKEMQKITEKTPRHSRHELIGLLNDDPFWGHIFNVLEKAIREVEPDHPFLSESNPY